MVLRLHFSRERKQGAKTQPGYPASWVIVTRGRSPQRSNQSIPSVRKRMAALESANASSFRRLHNIPRRARFGKPNTNRV